MTAGLLALAAALLFAIANNLQRHAAAQVPVDGLGAVRLLWRLLRTPRWLAGGGAATVGLVCQTVALGSGGVILVQSVIASTLVFSLLIEAGLERRRPRAGQLAGAGLVIGGILLLIGIGHPAASGSTPSPWRILPAWITVGVVGGGALLLARRRPSARSTAAMLGAAGGVCFALDAVFLRALAMAASPVPLVVAACGFGVASVLGNLTIQRGFQLAPLRLVLPALAAAEPLAAFAAGLLLFSERLQTGRVGLVAVAAGLAAMMTGVVVSAMSDPARSASSDPRVAAEERARAA